MARTAPIFLPGLPNLHDIPDVILDRTARRRQTRGHCVQVWPPISPLTTPASLIWGPWSPCTPFRLHALIHAVLNSTILPGIGPF